MHCTPTMLLRVLDAFGDAPVVAAHFGGYLLWKEVYDVLCGTDIYLDTAFSSGKMPPRYAKKLSTNILPIGFCSAVICLGVLLLMKLTLLKVLD